MPLPKAYNGIGITIINKLEPNKYNIQANHMRKYSRIKMSAGGMVPSAWSRRRSYSSLSPSRSVSIGADSPNTALRLPL